MRPNFKPNDITQIAKQEFGFSADKVSALGGYIDQNFLIENDSGEQRLFKAHSRHERPYVLELQNAVLDHLKGQSLSFDTPSAFITQSGAPYAQRENETDDDDKLRCLSFVSGSLISEFGPLDERALKEAGQLVGKLDKALLDFHHPAASRPDMEWDLANAPNIAEYLPLIKDTALRRLADYFFLQFDVLVAPKLRKLPRQVSHNDGHRYSLLGRKGPEGVSISGIIDFGDVLLTHRICNLSVTVSDLIVGQENLADTAARIVSGYNDACALTDIEFDLIYYLVGVRLSMYAALAGRALHEDPDNPHPQAKLGDVKDVLRRMIEINPIAWVDHLRKKCGVADKSTARQKHANDLTLARTSHFSSSLYTHYEEPLVLEGGAFTYLYDQYGNSYLDCVNNVCQWGHCHPSIVRAGQRQMAKLNTNSRYVHEPMSEFAQRLTDTMPDSLDTVFFVNSGSEANDLAARLARAFSGNNDLLVVDRAYHGNSSLATDISPNRIDRPGRPGLPLHVRSTECPDLYRGQFRDDDPQACAKYLNDMDQTLADMKNSGQAPAAFFAESLVGTGGQIVFPEGYLQGIYERVRKAGGVCIADEVQVGFGRTGDHMWCFESQNVVPDIVTMGKPMGNGHPMAAVVTRREIANAFDNGIAYFNTFGGNPVSCATGLAVLNVLEDEDLMANTAKMSARLVDGLKKLQSRFSCFGDIRGLGLYIGVEIVSDPDKRLPDAKLAKALVEDTKRQGVLLNTNGYDNNIIKIKPPLIIDARDIDRLLSVFETSLKAFQSERVAA